MHKNYRSYLEYKELRRQIEAKLSRPRTVLIHSLIFIVISMGLWYITLPPNQEILRTANTYPWGLPTTIWCFVLLAHALWGFFHSGLWPSFREKAIETEMGMLLNSDAPDFDDDEYFEVHRMLHEDIRQRSGYMFSLSMFAISNLFIWHLRLFQAAFWYSNPLWQAVIFAAAVFLLGGGVFNIWRSRQRELQRMHSNPSGAGEKRQPSKARYFATPDHGRLEIVEDDSPVFEKRKR
jgi:hypothetical protein